MLEKNKYLLFATLTAGLSLPAFSANWYVAPHPLPEKDIRPEMDKAYGGYVQQDGQWYWFVPPRNDSNTVNHIQTEKDGEPATSYSTKDGYIERDGEWFWYTSSYPKTETVEGTYSDIAPEQGMYREVPENECVPENKVNEPNTGTLGKTPEDGGDGSESSPWDITTAFENKTGQIKPGDTIYMMEGIYRKAERTPSSFSFQVALQGEPNQFITIKPMPGHHVRIDGGISSHRTQHPQFLNIDGLEVYTGEFVGCQRRSRTRGSHPKDLPGPSGGFNISNGYAVNIINNFVHDSMTNVAHWKGVCRSRIYGNVLYNSGWVAKSHITDEFLDRLPNGLHGPGIYTQHFPKQCYEKYKEMLAKHPGQKMPETWAQFENYQNLPSTAEYFADSLKNQQKLTKANLGKLKGYEEALRNQRKPYSYAYHLKKTMQKYSGLSDQAIQQRGLRQLVEFKDIANNSFKDTYSNSLQARGSPNKTAIVDNFFVFSNAFLPTKHRAKNHSAIVIAHWSRGVYNTYFVSNLLNKVYVGLGYSRTFAKPAQNILFADNKIIYRGYESFVYNPNAHGIVAYNNPMYPSIYHKYNNPDKPKLWDQQSLPHYAVKMEGGDKVYFTRNHYDSNIVRIDLVDLPDGKPSDPTDKLVVMDLNGQLKQGQHFAVTSIEDYFGHAVTDANGEQLDGEFTGGSILMSVPEDVRVLYLKKGGHGR